MKTYHQQNRKRGSSKALVLVVFIVLSLVGVDYVSGGKVRGVVRIAVEPVVYMYTAIMHFSTKSIGHIYKKSALLEENTKLRSEIAELSSVHEVNKTLESEVVALRNITDGVLKSDSVVVRILSIKGMGLYGTILIENVANTVSVGDIIRALGGGALGIVDSVDGSVATGVLFSAPNKKTEVRIGEKGITAEVLGRGGKNMLMTLPRDVEVVLGDVITAREFGGYVIGIVGDITMSDSDAFKIVRVLLIADPSTMQFVITEHDAK